MKNPSAEARYVMVSSDLRERISNGEFKPGDRLPSEAQLSASHGVSRGTVVRAIEQLVADGIVIRRQGAGSFVARPSLHRRSGRLLSFSESAAAEGLRSEQVLISIGQATSRQASEFHCDGPAVILRRLRSIDGLPCAVHRSVIPWSVASQVSALNGEASHELEDPGFSLYDALDAAGFRVREANERVTTRLAGPEERRLLGIEGAAPVMVVFRRSHDASGRLVEAVEAVYHGEFYTYDMRLVAAPSPVSDTQATNVLSLAGRIVRPQTRRK